MHYQRYVRLGLAGTACAILLLGADFWRTKDYTQWSDEEVSKLLTNSPWAKESTVTPQDSEAGRRRRGGFGPGGIGFPGGGIGFPGGGVGYPGGGYPGGGGYPRGGGYPGGGGYPNGGQYPDDGSGRGDQGPRRGPMHVTLRWESALAVQHALERQGAAASDEAKAVADASQKYYVIEMLGFRMTRPRNRALDPDEEPDSTDNDRGRSRGGQDQSNDALRSQLLDAAQLIPKGKRAIDAADVQVLGPNGSEGVRFLFPRTAGISAGDKEVDFILDFRRTRLEEKFRLNEMQYQGQLSL